MLGYNGPNVRQREGKDETMRANHVRRRLAAGQASIGTWLALPSPEAAEYMSRLGFDWLVVDSEHNAVDIRTLAQMFGAMGATSTAPMVRIPWNDPQNFKRVLDAGAWGIVVPMVNSREEAERAVEATRYHPLGGRSVGGGRHALSFATTASEYYAHANDEVLLVLQIEHIDGVEHADEIFSVPGVDACFIGPNDLGASMGIGLGVRWSAIIRASSRQSRTFARPPRSMVSRPASTAPTPTPSTSGCPRASSSAPWRANFATCSVA